MTTLFDIMRQHFLRQLIYARTRSAPSKRRRSSAAVVMIWAIALTVLCAAPHASAIVAEEDTVRTTTYEDQAEIEWMIDRATAAERPIALHHELRRSLGLDGPDIWYNNVVGCFVGSLTSTIAGEYTEDTLTGGLLRCNLYVFVRGGEDRTSGQFRWYSFRDTVLSLYLTIDGIRHGTADPRVAGGGDRRMEIHDRLHRYDTAGWNRYGEARGALFGEPPSATTDDTVRWFYWQLLGIVPVRDEYGWICEYSSIGGPPAQRNAVIELVCRRRVDLLRRVLAGPSPEGRLYAAEALAYLEMIDPGTIDEGARATIDALRERDEIVRTCGNAGSFRIYPVRFTEVFNDSNRRELPRLFRDAMPQCLGEP